eukprot:CAMPEP_0197036528 /NCGR_PEP_ID=MMETSP1384-20130603/14011_1 /TAXON_ID=29189 /ORGANISM="Ammonia sp." /LENGTH=597 /DNA_ID=CAMNT_0042466717 /DNA_START=33 /DNA_END=1826 /DNA_ORIENTATION=-
MDIAKQLKTTPHVLTGRHEEKALTALSKHIKALGSTIYAISTTLDNVEDAAKICKNQISEIFDPLITKLTTKKQQLVDELDGIYTEKKDGLTQQSATLTERLTKAEQTQHRMNELVKQPISLEDMPKRSDMVTSACNFHLFMKYERQPCTRSHLSVISNNLHTMHHNLDSLARISCAPTPELLDVCHDADDGEIFVKYKLPRIRQETETLRVQWIYQDEAEHKKTNQEPHAEDDHHRDDEYTWNSTPVALLDNDHEGDDEYETSFKVTKTGQYKVALIYNDSPVSNLKTVSVDRIDHTLHHLVIRRKEHRVLDPNKWHKYNKVVIHEHGELTTSPYNRQGPSKRKGGKLYIEAKTIEIRAYGKIHCNGKGYKGGQANKRDLVGTAYQGDSFCGTGGTKQTANRGGGGGGSGQGGLLVSGSTGGGGGGYGSNGSDADPHVFKDFLDGGAGGTEYGDAVLSTLHLGSGGGAGYGYKYHDGMPGGCGGGAIMLIAEQIVIEENAAIEANGEDGGDANEQVCVSGGGAGSGGSIYMVGILSVTNKGRIWAIGGKGGEKGQGFCSKGGDGGVGRIRIDCNEILDEGDIFPDVGYTKYHFYEF